MLYQLSYTRIKADLPRQADSLDQNRIIRLINGFARAGIVPNPHSTSIYQPRGHCPRSALGGTQNSPRNQPFGEITRSKLVEKMSPARPKEYRPKSEPIYTGFSWGFCGRLS